MKSCPPHPRRSGVTLVELLVVISVIAVLTALGAHAFTSIGKGFPMREATREVAGTLEAARQMAIAQNANTAFVVITDPALSSRYNVYGVLKYTFITSSTGGEFLYEPAIPFQSLPNGIYFQEDANEDEQNFGNLMNSPTGQNPSMPVRGTATTVYRAIVFEPAGDTATAGEANQLVVGYGTQPGVLRASTSSPDVSTFVVSQFTGRARIIETK